VTASTRRPGSGSGTTVGLMSAPPDRSPQPASASPTPASVDLPGVLPGVAAGDEQATGELWDRYAGRIRAMGLRLSGFDAGFADDLVQETFAKLWRSAASFDPARGTEASFVFTVARRTAVDQWRRGRRVATDRPLSGLSEMSAAVSGGPGSPEDQLDAVVTGWAVTEALGTLSAAQREVIELAYYGQLSQTEIAERLAIPLGTVKTRTYSALRALRAALVATGMTT
jgi:RNA polymerase sigma-70 factor (ECF subfamily)